MDPLLWTQSMDYPCGPPLIIENEFYQRSKQILGTSNEWNSGQTLLAGLWALTFYTKFNVFFLAISYQLNGFVLLLWIWSNYNWREQEEWCGGSSLLRSSFILSSCCMKVKKKQVHAYETIGGSSCTWVFCNGNILDLNEWQLLKQYL